MSNDKADEAALDALIDFNREVLRVCQEQHAQSSALNDWAMSLLPPAAVEVMREGMEKK
jgi:hypothetical protein